MHYDRWRQCDLGFADTRMDMRRKRESWNIRAWRQPYSKLGTVFLFAIIDGKSFPEFGRRRSHHVIQIGVIGRFSLKNLNADRTFFDLICRTVDGLLHNITQKRDRPLAGAKRVVANQ